MQLHMWTGNSMLRLWDMGLLNPRQKDSMSGSGDMARHHSRACRLSPDHAAPAAAGIMSTRAWQHYRLRVQPRAHSDMWEICQALHGHGDRPYALIYLKLWQGLLGLCTEPCSGMPFATIVAALPGNGRRSSQARHL